MKCRIRRRTAAARLLAAEKKKQLQNKFFLVLCCWEMSSEYADQSVFILANARGLQPDSFTLCQSNSVRANCQAKYVSFRESTKTKCPSSMKRSEKRNRNHHIDSGQVNKCCDSCRCPAWRHAVQLRLGCVTNTFNTKLTFFLLNFTPNFSNKSFGIWFNGTVSECSITRVKSPTKLISRTSKESYDF